MILEANKRKILTKCQYRIHFIKSDKLKTQNIEFQQTRYRKIFVRIFEALNPAY